MCLYTMCLVWDVEVGDMSNIPSLLVSSSDFCEGSPRAQDCEGERESSCAV